MTGEAAASENVKGHDRMMIDPVAERAVVETMIIESQARSVEVARAVAVQQKMRPADLITNGRSDVLLPMPLLRLKWTGNRNCDGPSGDKAMENGEKASRTVIEVRAVVAEEEEEKMINNNNNEKEIVENESHLLTSALLLPSSRQLPGETNLLGEMNLPGEMNGQMNVTNEVATSIAMDESETTPTEDVTKIDLVVIEMATEVGAAKTGGVAETTIAAAVGIVIVMNAVESETIVETAIVSTFMANKAGVKGGRTEAVHHHEEAEETTTMADHPQIADRLLIWMDDTAHQD
mmetsp:Transcript_32573/g.48291  ORF Transcript_32573/g.48291 Transcript_32573/m.48291 type:complete len:292 (+) Transcript_32573:923-1798(+)